jgi:hypothetical protein
MKARVTLTPEMMEKLVSRQSIYFKIKTGCTMLELRLMEDEDSFSQFDRVFSKLWKSVLDGVEKLVK